MDYTTCDTFTNFLQKYTFVQPKDLVKFIYDIHSVKHENVHYNADILTTYKLIELRKIASQFKIKQYYKMDKKTDYRCYVEKTEFYIRYIFI